MKLLLLSFLLMSQSVASAASKVVVTESSEAVYQWVYEPGRPLIDNPDSINADGVNLEWEDSGFRTAEDFVQPIKTFTLAVPPGTTPHLRIVSQQASRRDDGLAGRSTYVPAQFPQIYTQWAQLAAIYNWRGYRFARVEVSLQIGDTRASEILDKIHLAVVFTGTPSPAAVPTRDADLVTSIALNGREAATWWQPERPPVRGPQRLDEWPEFPLYRLGVEEAGLYKVTGAMLQSRGLNVIGQPSSAIKLFGNGGGLLPKLPDTPTDSALKEIAVIVEDGGDNSFDESDYILFYGRGVKGFDYTDTTYMNDQSHQNPFTKENIYFVGLDLVGNPGLRMASIPTSGNGNPDTTTLGREYVENDQIIFTQGYESESGLIWYMYTIGSHESRTVTISAENASVGDSAWLTVKLEKVGEVGNAFDIQVGDNIVSANSFTTSPWRIALAPGIISSGQNQVVFVNRSNATIYVNYIELEFTRSLTVSPASGTLEFYSPANQTGLFQYTVQDLPANSYLLDVSNRLNPRIAQSNTIVDSADASVRKSYFAVRPDRLRTPQFRGLKSAEGTADYHRLRDLSNPAGVIILTYDGWFDVLEPLKQFHENYREEPLPTIRVKLTDVYDEFGWGVRDVVAIRNFLEYAYENWRGTEGSDTLKYVLLVGDGDYDYRNLVSPTGDNWMPPWEFGGEANDDFFAIFDNDANAQPQLFVGRWPLQSEAELEAAINKTIAYATDPLYSSWKNTATFAADDEWKDGHCGETTHTEQSESLITRILPSYFTFKKIYEILYPMRATPTGGQKPEATRDLLDAIHRGTLIVNYAGHGNERIWTDEQLFVMDRDRNLVDNQRMWPLFVAATCDWGGFDRVGERCFPELLLADPTDGAIASLGATRVTFSGANNGFTNTFYRELFRSGLVARRSFGEAITIAKFAGFSNSVRLYHILGDPVLRLATPERFARVTARDDSMQALALFHLSGVVSRDSAGPVWSDFQGILEARVFDTQDSAVYYWPETQNCDLPSNRAFYYGLEGNAIFRGQASIRDGRFDVTFHVPRDIRYGGTNARISLYFYGKSASESDSADGIGIEEHLLIANEAANEADSVAPTIGIWLETPSFRSGDLVSATPLLHVGVADSSGINLSGEVGHRITVRVDDAATQDLTQFFNYRLDSYTTGSLEKTIGPLSVGEHQLLIEAWDSFNNLNQATLTFSVGEAGEAGYEIRDVLNWPNPMSEQTYFTYYLTQDGTHEVNIRVYSLSGKLVWESSGFGKSLAFNSNSNYPWDGRDREGQLLGNGVYLYRVRAENTLGHTAEATGKLVILR